MSSQPVQPVVAPARRAFNVHRWWVRLSILLLAAALATLLAIVTYRYTAAPAAPIIPGTPLGIDLPAGTNINELPTGLTDYLRPGSVDQARPAPAVPLGIDLPTGTKKSELPTGLTDYLRPQSADEAIQVQPHVPGIDLSAGTTINELPSGLTDYLRPQTLDATSQVQPHVPGIDCPASWRDSMPPGLTDYCRTWRNE